MKPSTDRVLIVDDEPAARKMLGVMLSQAGIASQGASNVQAALDVLPSRSFSAVISDLRMPGLSGLDLLAEVQRKYPELAFLVATGVDDVRVGVQAMRQGADDYLVKPFQLDIVLASLERAFQKKALQKELENYRRHLEEMIAKRTQQLQTAVAQLERSYSATLEALGSAIDLRDGPTAGHSRRVFWYSMKIVQATGGLEKDVRNLGMGAWLHDIGKLATPDAILLKPGALTPQEREVMQRHVQIGYDLVKNIAFLADAAEIILAHHERWDGSGYPRGLKADEIPVGARIFAVADSFDAMTSDRPYRSAIPFEAARDEIQRKAATLFDRTVVNVFLTIAVNEWVAIREEAASVQISTFR
ncbi:MAG TPA: HD domain-containing phosphohydrolase [Candidatus Acidoferrum sp.]|nr:HD domain-containing phosphohydrolase [Candidatus Acidoferrum sp.]